MEEYVWYACYGSNLSLERFKRYIDACSDKTMPTESRAFRFDHSIYFAKSARTWDGGGKAFLDDTASGSALGRIYKITRSQYEEIKEMEGRDYTKRVELGDIEGIPVYTFTDRQRNAQIRMPSAKYFQTILKGLKESFGELMEEKKLAQYLIDAILPKNAFAAVKAIKQNVHYLTNRQIAQRSGLSAREASEAAAWLLDHGLIVQDGRSIRAGHRVTDPEAYFYTADGPCARGLIAAMLEAIL